MTPRPPSTLRAAVHNTWILTDTAVYLGLSITVHLWTLVGGKIGKILQIPRNAPRRYIDD